MSDFKAKMHQLQFPLRLRPGPRWGSLQHSPGPPSCILGAYVKGERGRKEREVEEGKGKGREGEGKEMEGENELTHPVSQSPGYALREQRQPTISNRRLLTQVFAPDTRRSIFNTRPLGCR